MGLFDRFRRKVKETPPDEGLLADPESKEAQEAISEKLEMAKKEVKAPNRHNLQSTLPKDDEWDDDEPETDPFAKLSLIHI